MIKSANAWTARAALLALGAGALAVASPAQAQESTHYRVVATVERVGGGPTGVAVNTATKAVYVANSGDNAPAAALAVVDGNANAVERILFANPEMPNPTQVGVDSTSGQVFVTNPQAADVNKLTLISGDVITGTLNVGRMATSVTVDETDRPRKVYVSNHGDEARNVSGITIIHSSYEGFRVHATTAFSPSRGLTTVAVDTETRPHKAWAVNANTGADPLAGSLTVADSEPNRATFTNWSGVLPAPRKPGLVAMRPSSHTLYLADQVTDQVHLVDVAKQVPVTAPTAFATGRPAGDEPVAMAYDAGTDRLFVLYGPAGASDADGDLTVLDATSGDVLQHLTLPSPGGMAVDPTSGVLWVTDTANGKLRKIAERQTSPGPPRPPPFQQPAPFGGAPADAEPQKRELPGENENGQLCGAVTTRPRC